MKRSTAAKIGVETVAILKAGEYAAPSGRTVDLREILARAKAGTKSYAPADPVSPRSGAHETKIEVTGEGTLEAAKRLEASNPCALNFASAKHPGGGFMGGAIAQEEVICRSSGLYACIEGSAMYLHHGRDCNYSDWAIYSPGVPVIRDIEGAFFETPHLAAFITCAAPNYGASKDRSKIPAILDARAERVLAIASAHGHDTLVLGAWGCGVFRNDPKVVAGAFAGALRGRFRGVFRHVVFAILGGGANYDAFRSVFS